jgi:hypothetical protein
MKRATVEPGQEVSIGLHVTSQHTMFGHVSIRDIVSKPPSRNGRVSSRGSHD